MYHMSNRSKGVWGENPDKAFRYQRKPRHIHRGEQSDGCAGILIALAIFLGFVIAEDVIMKYICSA
jgi:hypothetical protein